MATYQMVSESKYETRAISHFGIDTTLYALVSRSSFAQNMCRY